MKKPPPLLEVDHLSVSYGKEKILNGLSFNLKPRHITGLIGGSGSGKSTIALAILRLLTSSSSISGKVNFKGENLLEKSDREMLKIRGKEIGLISQDPVSALDPLLPIGNQLTESMLWHQVATKASAYEKGVEFLIKMGISDPKKRWEQYPYELSGGMCQRIAIASTLSLFPKIIIADEPTSSLDVTLQAEILHQLSSFKDTLGLSILFITHDLAQVASLCDSVLVLKNGEFVETGKCEELFNRPRHPFTKQLIETAKKRYYAPLSSD